MNVIATIGHNRSPFDLVKESIEDLYAEAKLWLDGEPVTTQEQADALNTLQSRIREAAKEAEKARKAEAKPFDDGKAEVQARYKPIQNRADEADAAVKCALKPYLLELDRKQQEAARIAREEAERKQKEAIDAMRQRAAANLESREHAEKLAAEAKVAAAAAAKAEQAKAHAKGACRATGLRTVHRAVMVDKRDAAAWIWREHPVELRVFIQSIADSAVRAGARSIPGFNIVEEKVL